MEKERKVYEAPELRVHQTVIHSNLLSMSGENGGEAGEGSRRIWLDDDEE